MARQNFMNEILAGAPVRPAESSQPLRAVRREVRCVGQDRDRQRAVGDQVVMELTEPEIFALFIFVAEDRAAGSDAEVGQLREIVDDPFGDSIAQVPLRA